MQKKSQGGRLTVNSKSQVSQIRPTLAGGEDYGEIKRFKATHMLNKGMDQRQAILRPRKGGGEKKPTRFYNNQAQALTTARSARGLRTTETLKD